MQLSTEIKTSLVREHALCSNALHFYQKALKAFEDKYHITTRTFLEKCEAGDMGDEKTFLTGMRLPTSILNGRKPITPWLPQFSEPRFIS